MRRAVIDRCSAAMSGRRHLELFARQPIAKLRACYVIGVLGFVL